MFRERFNLLLIELLNLIKGAEWAILFIKLFRHFNFIAPINILYKSLDKTELILFYFSNTTSKCTIPITVENTK